MFLHTVLQSCIQLCRYSVRTVESISVNDLLRFSFNWPVIFLQRKHLPKNNADCGGKVQVVFSNGQKSGFLVYVHQLVEARRKEDAGWAGVDHRVLTPPSPSFFL
jgi:hypothetical protein